MTRGSDSRTMRLREVLREAWRDTASGASWAGVCALVSAVLFTAVVGGRVTAATTDVRAATDYVASGAATTVQEAEGRVDGRACDALAGSDGVVAAGALRRVEDGIVPAALPGTTLPTYEVTTGLLRLLDVRGVVGAPGVVLAPGVRSTLGLEPGAPLATHDGGRTTVSGWYAYPDDGRDPDLEYAALVPAVDDGRPFDGCWVTVWPEREDTVAALRRTVLPSSGAADESRPTLGQLNPRSGQHFVRAVAVPPLVTAAVTASCGLAVGGAAVWRRRLALASDRHVGVPRVAQVVGTAAQHLLWATVGGVVALASAVVLVRGLAPPDAVPIVRTAALTVASGVLGAVVGGALAAAAVRERALYRFFRAR